MSEQIAILPCIFVLGGRRRTRGIVYANGGERPNIWMKFRLILYGPYSMVIFIISRYLLISLDPNFPGTKLGI